MSDGVNQEVISNGVQSSQHLNGYVSHERVNDIIADRLARQEEKLRRQHEEELNKIKSSLPNEEAIAMKVRNELDAQYKQELQKQQEAQFQTQFARDKNQYQSLTKDIKVDAEEDECGLFSQEGERKYLALQVAAGNFNFEDTADIMKELARNPHKLIQANTAAKEGDWQAVKAMFKKISNSIKNNKSAVEARSNVVEPLSHIKASTGGSSGRAMTLSDWKKDPSLRG